MSVLLKDTGRQSEGRELLLEDFKKLGIKNKRLKDDLKSKNGNPNKRIKLTESTQKELEEAQKQTEEQRKLTKYWKKQTQELISKMAKEKQVWENKHKADTKEQSREITKLKFKLRAERLNTQSCEQKINQSGTPFELSNSP